MLPGDYDQTADVRQLTTYAIVGGVRREIESVALDREISNDMPAHVVGGNGITGGTGTIVWSPQEYDGFRMPTITPETTHTWDRQEHNSVSLRYTGDTEVARNVVYDPRFTGTASFLTPNASTTEHVFGALGDGYGLELRAVTGAAVSRARVAHLIGTHQPGWVALSVAAQRVADGGDMRFTFYNQSTATGTTVFLPSSTVWERHTLSVHVEHSWDSVYTEFNGFDATEPGAVLGRFDRLIVATGQTQQAALDQVSDYFDGDSPAIPGDVALLSQDSGVEDRALSPWHSVNEWPPAPGTKIAVYVTDGHTSWPRFTGRIDVTTGDVGGAMSSRIVDYRDQLNRPFSREALLNHHVPASDDTPHRFLGLNHWAMLVDALGRARFFTTPIAGDYAMLSVNFQGSAWTRIGRPIRSHGPSEGQYPRFHAAPWGYTVGSLYAEYQPSLGNVSARTEPLQITLMVAPDHSGNSYVRVIYGGDLNDRITLRVWPDRRVAAYWLSDHVVTLSAEQMRQATNVVLLIKGSTWTIRNDHGEYATGTQARSGSQTVSEIRVQNDADARIAGLVVDSPHSPDLEFRNVNFQPNVTFASSPMVLMMDMSPRLEERNIGDFIDEVCAATLTAAWFDEMGNLRMIASDRLHNADPVQTITTLDDVLGLSWETSLLDYRSVVHVNWKSATVSRAQRHRKELYRGSGDSLETGDVVEVFAVPSADTEWFGVDRAPVRLNDTNWGRYNRVPGSYVGVHYRDADDNELATASRTTTIRTENIGTVGLKITHIAGNYGPNVEGNLSTSEDSTALRESRKGDNLPVIRGRGEGTWGDETTTSSRRGRTLPDGTDAPELVHDLGPWGYENSAIRIADFLAERVTRAEPTIRSLRVTYDPRRQLGDVVILELGVLDVTLTALIVGISEAHEAGNHEQQLTVRIIDATSSREVTYEELTEAWSGRDYRALETVWANLTYRDFQHDPLKGA